MELKLLFADVCDNLEVVISARNPQVLAGAGEGQSSQHSGGSRNRPEENLETRWKIKAGPGVALKSIKHRERIEALKAA